MAAAAELNCLGMLGLTTQHLSTLKQWASGDHDPGRCGKVEICGDAAKAVGAGKPWQEISPAQIERVRLMFVHFLEIMWEWCFRYLILQFYTSVRAASPGQEVSLRFKSKEQCNFLREETREEEAPRSDCFLLVFLGGMSWCKIPKKRWIDGYAEYDFPMQCVVCFPMCTPCCQRIDGRRKHVEEVTVGGVLRSAITSKVGMLQRKLAAAGGDVLNLALNQWAIYNNNNNSNNHNS